MGLRNQKQIQIEMDRASGRAVKRMAKRFRRDIGPLIAAIEKAKSPEGLERALGPTLLKRMGTDAVADALSVETLKAVGAGMLSAAPRGMANGE